MNKVCGTKRSAWRLTAATQATALHIAPVLAPDLIERVRDLAQ